MPEITILYAGVLGLMSLGLAAIPGTMRGKLNISVGDGGREDLTLAMRRHANFCEHVPIVLIMIAFLEMNNVSQTAIHLLAAGLVIFRLTHAMGPKAIR